jgi:organic radical activating enzyme
MPEPSILKINEIFWSFQGEGLRAGYPSIFLRLAGCGLRCPYCDTQYAWETVTSGTMAVHDILAEMEQYRAKYPHSQVVLTGGEPLEQDLAAIVYALKQKNYFIAVETNGLYFQDVPIDWWTVSPKDVTDYTIHRDLVKKAAEIKLIANKNLTPDAIKRVRGETGKVPIFLQPDASSDERYAAVFSLFRRCQEEGIDNIRAGIQLHTIYRVK